MAQKKEDTAVPSFLCVIGLVLPTQKMFDKAARIRPGQIIYHYPIDFQALLLDLRFRNAFFQTKAQDVFVLFGRDPLGIGTASAIISVSVCSVAMTGIPASVIPRLTLMAV